LRFKVTREPECGFVFRFGVSNDAAPDTGAMKLMQG
jgi:hypothetical protein